MKRLIALLLLILPALACNLGAAPSTPTPAIPTQAPAFNQPTLGLSPVVGPPGTIMNISAAGFTAGTRVNLFVSTLTKTSTVPITTLTIGEGGYLKFAFQLPSTIDGVPIQNNTPLVFTLTAESGNPGASALFLALTSANSSAVQPTSIPGFSTGGTGGSNNGSGGFTSGTTADLFITAPPIGSTQASGSVIVTGSGSSTSGRVTVQIQDANNAVIGSAVANIQALPGYVGAWEATVAYQPPTTQQSGYIVAFTSEGKQASIPVILNPSGFAQPGQAIPALYPTLPPTTR